MPYHASRRERKNYLPTILLTGVLWAVVVFIIVRVDPNLLRDIGLPNSYLPFFVLLFATLFLTLSLLASNTPIGLLSSLGIVFFLYLRLWGLGNIINVFLLVAMLTAVSVYWRTRTHN